MKNGNPATITNRRERTIAERHAAEGWEVLKKGWPDFLFYKDGEIKLVEVKKTPRIMTRKGGLSPHQRRMREILSKHFPYTVEYID